MDSIAVEPSPLERKDGKWSEAGLGSAVERFVRLGCLQIDKVMPAELTSALTRAYDERYRGRTKADLAASSLQVGHRRFMVTVDLAPPFDEVALYANPFVFPLLTALLGSRLVLSSFGVVTALPGSDDQHLHRDHPPLFPELPIGPLLPCYAVTLVVPLVDLDRDTVGTTAVWPGTHREVRPHDGRSFDSAVFPKAAVGSVYLMDYRLLHAGTANRSDIQRPILYLIYARPWFTDAENYSRQAKISISAARLAAVPDVYQSLFLHARS